MPELVIQLTRAGFLALLWLFVLAALRVVRSDLFSASGMRAPVPGSGKLGGKKQPKQSRGRNKAPRNKAPRNLVVTHGALAGTRISLDGRPILIGRADDSTLVLDDDYASTRHARLSLRGSTWYVEDLGSTNGTYLDRAKVTGPTEVRLGVPIRIGKTVIELRS
ncbi:FHA domain-containing protein [Salinifilum aidingensis]